MIRLLVPTTSTALHHPRMILERHSEGMEARTLFIYALFHTETGFVHYIFNFTRQEKNILLASRSRKNK